MELDGKDINQIIESIKDYVGHEEDRTVAMEAAKIAVLCDIATALEKISTRLQIIINNQWESD